MNPQPTIFISSIISEFYDLRGALRYFLGKNGFRVLMSEEPDFGVDCNSDSLPTCKSQIEKADYYLLIIGDSPGTTFKLDSDEDTTVTIEEFMHFVKLREEGYEKHFIVFIRNQTWDNYINNDLSKLHKIQYKFIHEILNNTKDKILGRWRYKFDKFADIISVLETNQNGLFLDTTRKQTLYKSYLKKEFLEIYRNFFSKKNNQITSIIDLVDLPELDFQGDILNQQPIDRKTASLINVLIIVFKNKNDLLQKSQRIFIYIAQGEFSTFNPQEEKYEQPNFIKLSIQVGEMLERIINNTTNIDIYERINRRFIEDRFTLSKSEYTMFIKPLYSNIKIVFSKITNLINFFESSLTDLSDNDDDFYAFRGIANDEIKNDELIEYSKNYFNK